MARKQIEAVKALQQMNAAGYRQCTWETDAMRCRYPASIDEKWCTEHYRCADPIWGGHVTSASQDYRHPTEQQRAADANKRLQAQARTYIEQQGLTKRHDELSKDYVSRLRAHCRRLFVGVIEKQRAA